MRVFLLLAAAAMLTARVSAQVSLAPPAATPEKPAAAAKPATAEKAKIRPLAKKPAAPPAPPPAATATPEPPDDPNADLVYGAYQRGLYKTAFDLAMKRAQEKSDPKAMTMLGELYANAFGV
ncbi:MAG: HcpA family protein, partial [Bradyrhizobium sp.]